MKTQPLRQKKNCLNCGKHVHDRYCSHCGQENVAPHETFGHLVKHFVSDLFHYDSRFLLTIKYLFTKPGFLTREYREGRRVTYVNPINLYVFTSFIFFFIYIAWITHPKERPKKHDPEDGKKGVQLGYFNDLTRLERKVLPGVQLKDAAAIRNYNLLEKIATVTTVEEFDAIHQQLPDSLQLSGWAKVLTRAEAGALKHYSSNEEKERDYQEGYYHNFPKVMLLCLPLFAWFLKIIYIRNKQWLYVDHAIFTLHVHGFLYIVLAVLFPLSSYFISTVSALNTFHIVLACIFIVYLIAALHKNYAQVLWKSCLKGVVLYGAYFMLLRGVLLTMSLLLSLYHTYF
ncbi:DUF3667 domain-containing protein [Chitinophaga sp. Hz27]|uniref:DUF3667 domain-containing protein n=1 Tax=Chitinophaga sp. Hz27 TaxID=3347169 RepID=UPI0035E344D3